MAHISRAATVFKGQAYYYPSGTNLNEGRIPFLLALVVPYMTPPLAPLELCWHPRERMRRILLLGIGCVILSTVAGIVYSQVKIKRRVRLEVPLVKQQHKLCGPSTIEMVWRYWGVTEYDQFDLARNILKIFPDTPRVLKSGILQDAEIDWKKYPGTGTSTMRKFSRKFGQTPNWYLKSQPKSARRRKHLRRKHFRRLKRYLSDGVPVIVHQYWKGRHSNGHYRVVVGYDEDQHVVFLKDSSQLQNQTQTYEEFLEKWDFKEDYLHYNALVFNPNKRPVKIELPY